MRNVVGLSVVGLLTACVAEEAPTASPEAVEAAVERAHHEQERATAKVPDRALGRSN